MKIKSAIEKKNQENICNSKSSSSSKNKKSQLSLLHFNTHASIYDGFNGKGEM